MRRGEATGLNGGWNQGSVGGAGIISVCRQRCVELLGAVCRSSPSGP